MSETDELKRRVAEMERKAEVERLEREAAARPCVCGNPTCPACWRRLAREAAGRKR